MFALVRTFYIFWVIFFSLELYCNIRIILGRLQTPHYFIIMTNERMKDAHFIDCCRPFWKKGFIWRNFLIKIPCNLKKISPGFLPLKNVFIEYCGSKFNQKYFKISQRGWKEYTALVQFVNLDSAWLRFEHFRGVGNELMKILPHKMLTGWLNAKYFLHKPTLYRAQ